MCLCMSIGLVDAACGYQQRFSHTACASMQCLYHNTVLTAFLPSLTSRTVRTSWPPPKNLSADQRCRENYCNRPRFLLWKTWICFLQSAFAWVPLPRYWQVSGVEFKLGKGEQRPQESRGWNCHRLDWDEQTGQRGKNPAQPRWGLTAASVGWRKSLVFCTQNLYFASE